MPEDPTPTPTPDPDPTPDPTADLDWEGPFDEDRARATIVRQRVVEKELRERLAETRDASADTVAARRELGSLRAEAKRAKELEARLKEIEDAEKTELERAQERAQRRIDEFEERERQWEQEKKETTLRLAVIERQQTLGIKSPGLALAALDRATLEWADGQPTNLDDQLSALLEREPLLKGEPAAPPPPNLDGPAGTGSGDSHGLTVAELDIARSRGITPERYAAMKTVENLDDYEKLQAKAAPQPSPTSPIR